jgi:PKD repeat protein
VEVKAGAVRYLKNGQVLRSLVPTSLSYPVRVDTSLYSAGAALTNVVGYGNFASNLKPMAFLGSGYRWSTGENIRFDGSLSSDPDGTLTSYDWDFGDGSTGSGATPVHAYGSPGTYTVTLTVTDNLGLTAAASTTAAITSAPTSQITWLGAVGVTASPGNLQKTAADGWNAGAVSAKGIAAGNGFVETTIAETNTYRLIGLSQGNTDQGYQDVDFAIYPAANGQLYIFEKGVNRGPMGSYAPGDRLRVSVDGAVVRYIQNGRVLGTSVQAPAYPLLVDTSLYSVGATLGGVRGAGFINAPPTASAGGSYEWSTGSPLSFRGTGTDTDGTITSYQWNFGDGTTSTQASPSKTYAGAGTYTASLTVTDNDGATATSSASVVIVDYPTVPVTWTNMVGVDLNYSGIYKSSITEGWNAGAVSTQTAASGNVFVQASIWETDYRLIGLGQTDTDQGYADVDAAIYPAGDGRLYVFENGVNRGSPDTYEYGDRVRVSVRAGVVRYIKNGRILFSSGTVPPYPLRVDTSLYSPNSGFTDVIFGKP